MKSDLPTYKDQLRAGLVTTLTNSIIGAINSQYTAPQEPQSTAPQRRFPSGIYVCENRYLYAVLCYKVHGRRLQNRIARGPIYDFSQETVDMLSEKLRIARQQAHEKLP